MPSHLRIFGNTNTCPHRRCRAPACPPTGRHRLGRDGQVLPDGQVFLVDIRCAANQKPGPSTRDRVSCDLVFRATLDLGSPARDGHGLGLDRGLLHRGETPIGQDLTGFGNLSGLAVNYHRSSLNSAAWAARTRRTSATSGSSHIAQTSINSSGVLIITAYYSTAGGMSKRPLVAAPVALIAVDISSGFRPRHACPFKGPLAVRSLLSTNFPAVRKLCIRFPYATPIFQQHFLKIH